MVALAATFGSAPARHRGRVIFRQHRAGSVWAWRAPSAGHRPNAPALFLPARTQERAYMYQRAALAAGFASDVKPGSACAIWRPGSPLHLQCPPWACKVHLPRGMRAAQARALLRAQWVAV